MWLRVAAVSLALTVAACGPPTVTLERLVAEQDDLSGRRISVSGRVVTFDEPDGTVAFVLEDERQNRVLLLPAAAMDGHTGEQVVVTGKFEFDPEVGRVLRVGELRIVRSDATSQPSATGP